MIARTFFFPYLYERQQPWHDPGEEDLLVERPQVGEGVEQGAAEYHELKERRTVRNAKHCHQRGVRVE